MRSLTSLIRESDPRDPLVRVVRALLDSGLIVATRDGAGRFVHTSDVYATALGMDGDVRGEGYLSGQRYFDPQGRELPRADHPAQQVRMSGIPLRNRVLGVRSGERELWFQASYMPLEQETDGWGVLTVGVPLERVAFSPPPIEEPSYAEPLLAFAEAVAGGRLEQSRLAELLRKPVEAIGGQDARCTLVWRRGDHLEVQALWGGLEPLTTIPYAGESVRRWEMGETFHMPHVRETDVMGNRIAVEYDTPIRSFALVPIRTTEGDRVASITVTHAEPGALTGEQIRALERLGRLAGAALSVPTLSGVA